MNSMKKHISFLKAAKGSPALGSPARGRWVLISFCILAAIASISGCATTADVAFASVPPPGGGLKYAAITANALGGSVLQRFYAQYPRDQYQVVACEKVSKGYLPFLATFGGMLLGGLITVAPAFNAYSYDAGGVLTLFGIGAIPGAVTGNLLGTFFKDQYIVTYVEKAANSGSGVSFNLQ
ncbi:MAG: hypothetical protein LBR16_02600 [Treponema sp.]|jgi:hypothetical protein|nr:hypothetical protein [Treponema sp.]